MTRLNNELTFVIVTECPYSGILRAIIEHSKLFFRLGINIVFIIPSVARDRYGEKLIENVQALEKYGKIIRSPLRRKYRMIYEDKKSLEKQLTLIQNKIVLSYTGYAGKLCRMLYKENIIKTLYHVPQCIDIVRRPMWQKPIESFFEYYLSKYASYYIASSQNEAQVLENKYNIEKNKILLIPNFISFEEHLKHEERIYDFVILGRVSADKRIINILNAANELNILDKFIVIGDGAELSKLKKMFPVVNFIGHINNDSVKSFLQKSKFIVSSSIIEGLPFAIIEAMHEGVIPIISDIPAHHDLISGKSDGFFFKNKFELKKVLSKVLLINPATRKNYSDKVRSLIISLSNSSQEKFINHFNIYGKRK